MVSRQSQHARKQGGVEKPRSSWTTWPVRVSCLMRSPSAPASVHVPRLLEEIFREPTSSDYFRSMMIYPWPAQARNPTIGPEHSTY